MGKVPKKISKIFKYTGFSLAGLAFLVFSGTAFLIKTGWGKNYSGDIIAAFIQNKTGTKATIGTVNIGFREIVLNNVVVYDDHGKILLKFARGKLIIQHFRQTDSRIVFKRFDVDNLIFSVVKYPEDNDFNITMIVKRIQQQQKNGNGSAKKIIISEININNSEFDYYRQGRGKKPGKIDYDHFSLSKVNSRLTDFRLYKSNISFRVRRLSTVESDGLLIKNIRTDVEIDTNRMIFNNLVATTPESNLKGELKFLYNGYNDFQDFISKVKISGALENSTVSFYELSWFGKQINTTLKDLNITGKASGYVDNLNCKNVKLKFGNNSYFTGDIRLAGLPIISETLIDINTPYSKFYFEDIQALVPSAKLPENLFSIGGIRFTGKYTGFINDFVAYGNVTSDFGSLTTDLNFKIPVHGEIPSYSGNITMVDFDLGKLFHQEKQIGKVSLTGSVKGKGFKLKDVDAVFDVQSNSLEFNNYQYQNLSFKGQLVQTDFNGGILINDPNMYLDFNGNIDLASSKPKFRYKAVLRNANLHKLNFINDVLTVNCSMDINIKAGKPDDAEGKIKIWNALFEFAHSSYHFDSLTVFTELAGKIKNIRVRSDIANIDLNGNFNIMEIPDFLKKSFTNYVDSSFHIRSSKISAGQYMSFRIDMQNNEVLNQILKSLSKTPLTAFNQNNTFKVKPYLHLDDNSHLEGYISHGSKTNISFYLPGIQYGDFYIKNWKFSAISHDSQGMVILSQADKLIRKDSIFGENINLSSNSSRENIMMKMSLINHRLKSNLDLNAMVKLKKDSFELYIDSSSLTSNNIKWNINSKRIVIRYIPEIEISFLELNNAKESVKILGSISSDKEKSLRILPDNLNLDHITYLVNNKKKFDFSGILNGQVSVHNLLGYSFFDAAVVVSPLIYRNKDSLGILNIFTSYNESTKKNNVHGSLENQDLDNVLALEGDIDFNVKKDLNLTLTMPESDVRNLQPFIKGLFSDLGGKMKGSINFTGNVAHPSIKGTFSFINASLKIDYLNTYYSFTHDLTIDEKGITATNVKLKDMFGTEATLNGVVKHDFFRNFYFDLGIVAKNLYALNTIEAQNNIFHGQAFASGNLHIYGPLEKIKMDMQLSSEENTKIIITTYGTVTAGQYYFVRFTSRTDETSYKQNISGRGLTVSMNLEITPDAEIQLLLDPEMHDMIKGKGKGNIKLEVDNLGNIGMYGSYFIEEGEYYFSAMDVIKRKFNVVNGSSITWSGDPINAKVNIEAVYKIDANVDDLLRESGMNNTNSASQSVPVQAKINLTELLFSPDIKLDFDILNSKSLTSNNLSTFEQKISYIKNDEQELNKQVIALLVMHKFLPVNSGIQAQTTINEGITSNVSTLISSQVSSWLSRFSNNFDSKYISDLQVGVNYATDSKLYQKQLELAMGANLLNNRINVTGSYDIENINNNFEASYLFKNSRMRFKVFSRSDNNPIYLQNITRQGLGIFFRKEYDDLGELFRSKKSEKLKTKN